VSEQIGHWWAVALTDEVGPGKPKAVFVNDEPIVLFRDKNATVRALENRCPHRRMPLSLGTVRSEGWLQCGYHGWSFDGATGQCKAIPNLHAGEKVPSTYGVFPYLTAERNGLIYITASSQPRDRSDAFDRPSGRSFRGRRMVGLAHDEYVATLMDGPHLLLNCAGMRIAETMIADPRLQDGWLVMERAAFWAAQFTFDGFVREYKLIFRLAIHPDTGEAWIRFLRPDDTVVSTAHWAITPSARGTTAILWRSFLGTASGMRPALLQVAALLGRAPIAPRERIDMAAVAALLVGPSEHWPRAGQISGLYGDRLGKERARI
jgi:nitrite reductase/ring-hydroxylating ferredoxin subunit